jgi:hypothetical protein
MSLTEYFSGLIRRVEESEIQNNGKDKDGFFKPTRRILLRHLNLLKDLHGSSRAEEMIKDSWEYVVSQLPPEWLVLDDEQKKELKKILGK